MRTQNVAECVSCINFEALVLKGILISSVFIGFSINPLTTNVPII